ncbi:MAG: hypothetical protein A2289_06580 [Deltaproteobacteria bacterium RIFOXYA12_FULL_58_15]|nr:MAG: hypothetical protein A2289_06580 [Deltaproteobacteria bacterium RIFOXYA12_FULL_58_15]
MQSPSPDKRVLLALGLVTGGTLLLEVTLIRLLSVALWYPFAYMALSTAMLGFGGAAVIVSLSFRLRKLPLGTTQTVAALGFCLSTVGGYPLWNILPVEPMNLAHDLSQLLWLPLLLILISVPFMFAGLFVARTFAAWPQASPLLYFADLVGATVGVIVFVICLPTLGGPGTLVFAGATGAVAALVLARGTLGQRVALALTAAGLLAAAAEVERIVPLRITPNKLLGTELARRLPRGSKWTLSSTIDVIEPGRNLEPIIIIDGGTAMTHVPRVRRNAPLPPPEGLRALPYLVTAGRSTLVIGSGGGVEVAAALGAGSERVLAIEIDSAINDLVRGKLDPVLGGLFHRPGVELVTAEARSYLAAHEERFDVIAAFHTISNAASSTGAMSLAESYLLTTEALELLLARLSDQGVLVMSRPEQQLGRLCATMAAAWPHESDLHAHVAILTQTRAQPDFLAAVVVSRQPLSEEQLQKLRAATPGRVVYLPGGDGDAQEFFDAALSWPDPQKLATAQATPLPYTPATLNPTTDNRPFFNLPRPWTDIGFADVAGVLDSGVQSRQRLEELPVGQVAILILLLEASLLAFLFVLPPSRVLRKSGVDRHARFSVATYFAALGFAFITVEVVLIQAMTRIVGEPAWSMLAVLATLLSASGAGSIVLAGRLQWSPARACIGAATVALVVAAVVPTIADVAASLPFAARVGVVVITVAPAGFLMGAPFSAGLSRLERSDLVAWAWALNGLLAVGGSIAALVLGSSIGFAAAACLAAAIYGVAALSGRGLGSSMVSASVKE